MRVEQRELLRAMHDVDGVVDVQCHLARRADMAGAIDVDQGVYLLNPGRARIGLVG
jgi:hypothetical protein